MIESLFLLAAAQQPVAVPPPAPPPLPPVGTELFEVERANYADALRRACMSEAGIVIAIDHWTRLRRTREARRPLARLLEQELGDAALTIPVDLDRLARALDAHAQYQARMQVELNQNSLALLRRLSPADRAIYARRVTIMQPAVWPRSCTR